MGVQTGETDHSYKQDEWMEKNERVLGQSEREREKNDWTEIERGTAHPDKPIA